MALSAVAKKYAARLNKAVEFEDVMAVERDVAADAKGWKAMSADDRARLSRLFAERAAAVTGVEALASHGHADALARTAKGRRKRR